TPVPPTTARVKRPYRDFAGSLASRKGCSSTVGSSAERASGVSVMSILLSVGCRRGRGELELHRHIGVDGRDDVRVEDTGLVSEQFIVLGEVGSLQLIPEHIVHHLDLVNVWRGPAQKVTA